MLSEIHQGESERAGVQTGHGALDGITGADSYGKVHGTHNVWVNDASLLPTATRPSAR